MSSTNTLDAKRILAKEKCYKTTAEVDYVSLCEPDRFGNPKHYVKLNLASRLAKEVLAIVPVETFDAPDSRHYQITAYIFSRQEMLEIVQRAFDQGRLNSPNYHYPSNNKT